MRKDISGWNVQWDDARAAQWVAGGQWLNRTLADAVREAAETEPGRVTQLCGGYEVTAGEDVEVDALVWVQLFSALDPVVSSKWLFKAKIAHRLTKMRVGDRLK